jgi:hypothetical protein
MIPPPPPPAVVSGCSAVPAAQTAASKAGVWTDLRADVETGVKERFAQGTVQVGVAFCSLLRVNFSDGTSWDAPPATTTP